jgi:hypothetical protein
METLDSNSVYIQLSKAQEVLDAIPLIPEVEKLSVKVGPDSYGESALWLQIHVRADISGTPDQIERLTEFGREVQAKIFDKGITLFPYTSMEQAALENTA